MVRRLLRARASQKGCLSRVDMEAFRDAYLAGSGLRPTRRLAASTPRTWTACPGLRGAGGLGRPPRRRRRIRGALREAGVAATVADYEDMAHGFVRWGGALDAARDLHAQAGSALRTAFA